MNTVLGIDACKSGWVGIAHSGGEISAHHATTIAGLVDAVGTPAMVAIDIPIGLPDRGFREADLLARDFLGHRRSSVFMTPVRAVLDATGHQHANELSRAATGQGISIQAFSLVPKIRDVDDWLPKAPCPVVEVHPEVSFAELAGGSLPSKKTWAGVERRRELLAAVGFAPTGPLGEAGRRAAVDDILDAAVAAWSARRVLAGTAVSLPDRSRVAPAIWR